MFLVFLELSELYIRLFKNNTLQSCYNANSTQFLCALTKWVAFASFPFHFQKF